MTTGPFSEAIGVLRDSARQLIDASLDKDQHTITDEAMYRRGQAMHRAANILVEAPTLAADFEALARRFHARYDNG